MKKTNATNIEPSEYRNLFTEEFWECIDDLFSLEEVQRLEGFFQHCGTTRLQHSLNVSYYSFVLAKHLGGDFRSAARAGMLHDLFWYDWRTEKTPQLHAFYHPKNALENAEKITELNEIERDAIVKHMFPLCSFPQYRESYYVTVSDKYSATVEILEQFSSFVKSKYVSFKSVFSRS